MTIDIFKTDLLLFSGRSPPPFRRQDSSPPPVSATNDPATLGCQGEDPPLRPMKKARRRRAFPLFGLTLSVPGASPGVSPAAGGSGGLHRRTVDRVIQAERDAFLALTDGEAELFVRSFRRYNAALSKLFDSIGGTK